MNLRNWVTGAVLAAVIPGAASAAVVTVDGSLYGANFDISYDDALLGLFGTPTIVGNSVQWFPSGSPGFTASTSGFDTTVFANSTFAVKITADAGYQLTGASLSEAGDYLVFGTGSMVAATGQLRMTSLSPSAPTVVDSIAPTGAFSSGTFGDPTSNWSATADVALAAPADSANVSIQNILLAYGGNVAGPRLAFIEKKEVTLAVGVAPIPEPATWAMMATGAILLGFGLRRNRA